MIARMRLFRYSSGMATPGLEAVIFDYGEVLSLHQDGRHRARLLSLSGLSNGRFWEAYRRIRPDYDRGAIDGMSYWSRVLALPGSSLDPGLLAELVREDVDSWSRINQEMLAWSRTLRTAGYKTAILSNMPADNLVFLKEKHPWFEEFPVRIFSCRLGLIKPEPAIYHRCLEALEVPPASALFLDDTPGNVSAARALGMRAAVFRSPAETLPPLIRRYGLPPLPGETSGPGPQPE